MGDRLITLGLADLAREQASEWATRRQTPVAAEPDTFSLQPDLLEMTLALGRDVTPEDLVFARRMARLGRPDRLYDIYDEMIRFGPGPQLSKAARAISETRKEFLPPEEFRDESDTSPEALKAREIADAVRKQFKPHVDRALAEMFPRFSHGIVGLHTIVEPRGADGGRERIVSIEQIPPHRFELSRDTQEVLYRPFANDTTTVPVAPFVESGHIAVFQEAGRLDRRGLLFQCLIPWVMASFGLRWLARLAELCGIPYRAIWYDETKPGQKRLASRIGEKLGSAGWAAFPKGMEVQFINALSSTGGAGEIHERLVRLGDRSYDKVILGHEQASNVEVGAGSRTSSEEASKLARDLDQSRASTLATEFTEGLIRPYVRRNWGDDAAVLLCPMLIAMLLERKDGKALSEIALNLQRAGATRIDENELIRACGLIVAKDETQALPSILTSPGLPAATGQMSAQNVLPFPSRFSVDAAPDGSGEEIVAPYRAIVQRGVREGATPQQILSRIRDRSTAETDAPELADQLATLMLNGLMRGITDVRKARAKK